MKKILINLFLPIFMILTDWMNKLGLIQYATFTDLLWTDGTDNMGGIQTIGYFIPVDDIDTEPTIPEDSVVMTGDYVLESEKYWNKIYSTQETNSVVDENQGEVDGQSFKHIGTIFFPGTTEGALSFARMVNNSNMVFILLDAQGVRRVIGSKAFPAKCKPSFTTGVATADRKGMTMQIVSYGNWPAPVYKGDIQLSASETIPPVS